MPLTASGKVDRGKLEDLHRQRPSLRPPSTQLQQLLLEVYEEALGTALGVDDDFFALGGHSVAALRLQSLLARRDLRVELRDVFRFPTVLRLAERLEVRTQHQAGSFLASRVWSQVVRLQQKVALASFAQERLWMEQLIRPGPSYNVAFAFRVEGVSQEQLLVAVVNLVRRHEVLRTVLRGGLRS